MKNIKHLILDMDGVMWRGSTAVPGLVNFIDTLRELEIDFVFATNNASRTIAMYVEKFARLGVFVEPWQILSAGYVTAAYLANQYPNPSETKAYVLGSFGLHDAMRQAGFDVVNQVDEMVSPDEIVATMNNMPAVDLVVTGFKMNATYTDFSLASIYIDRGAHFYGSNEDTTFPHEAGRLPGAGAFMALLETATGVKPTIIGKPNTYIFEEALQRLGSVAADTAMVGDRLNTDIQGAANTGLTGILVLTGIATEEDVRHSDLKPDYIFEDVTSLGHAFIESKQKK